MVLVRRFLPLAIGALLLGLPFLAEGISNPPTIEEVRLVGQSSPTVSDFMSRGHFLGFEISHLYLLRGKGVRMEELGSAGELAREAGVWQLKWNFFVGGAGVIVEQLISDRSGRVLREQVHWI